MFPLPSEGRGTGGYAVFAGRLSPEKGVRTLVHAWQHFELPLPLKIAGTGPLEDDLRTSVARDPRIALLGALDRSALLDLVGDARVMVVPSEVFETFGLVAAESLAVGTPLIVSRIGALPEFVSDRQVGEQFDAGDAASLAAAVHRFLASRVHERERRRAARASFEARYSPDAHLFALTRLYEGLTGPRSPDL